MDADLTCRPCFGRKEMFRRFVADFMAPDQATLDPTPDSCWRCDASPSTHDLGLCEPCKASLTRGTA